MNDMQQASTSIRAPFITIEGVEGVGKSTAINSVAQLLHQHQIKYQLTREPGGTPLAEQIRQLILCHHEEKVSDLTELLLVFAGRAQHISHVIEPALSAGEWVICDRFTDATYAYQGGGRGLSLDIISQLEQLVQGTLRPDLTLLLDAPVEVGMARAQARGKADRIEQQALVFFQRVRQVYLNLAKQQPQRFILINADQEQDKVTEDIKRALFAFIATRQASL